jgi:hypothetical protein
MNEQDMKTIETQLLEDYKRTRSVICMEMLKSAFKPFIDQTVERNRNSGLRRDDIQAEIERLFEEAVEAYDIENAKLNSLTLTSWVFQCMKRLPERLQTLHERILLARTKRS